MIHFNDCEKYCVRIQFLIHMIALIVKLKNNAASKKTYCITRNTIMQILK